ncbi:unnamed protein product [Prorocentrum cordatum]|uniref:Uncharacterized protein n=1 Tax=Prorocentrum cordatum TaxID=2364126 RepID=A0ABN9TFW2_9DINO|nr:unnamed protein product [Polarella glacialis]
MPPPILRPWLWLRYQGEALYHQRRVVGVLASSATQVTDADEVIGVSPDGDPEQIDLSGASRDIEAWCWSEVFRPPPPGIPRGQVYRFQQEPDAAALATMRADAEAFCDAAFLARERAAGQPAVLPATGSLVDAVWPAPAAPAAAAAAAPAAPGLPLALPGMAAPPGPPALGAPAAAAAPLALLGAPPAALPGAAPPGAVVAAPLAAAAPGAAAPAAFPAAMAAGAPAAGAPLAAGLGMVAAAPYPVMVTVETTTYGPRGTPVAPNGTEVMSGDVGIHTAPGYGGLLVRTIRSDQVQDFKGLEAAGDARLLSVIAVNGQRSRRAWRDVASSLSEIAFPDWAIEGPRTTLWCCRWIDRRGGGPLDHRRFFVMVHRLHKDSWGVPMHEFGMKALETLGAYDSLDLPNVAGIESLMREVQLVEYAYAKHDGFAGASTEVADGDLNAKKKGRGRGRGRGGAAGAFGYLDEHTAFRGQRETGDAMVCPALVEWVGKQAGEHFDEPPHVDLATGSAFSALELPPEFWQFFGLPRVRAGVLGITTDSAGGPLRASDWGTPCFTAVPMGWKHILWICQRIMEFRARTNTLASPSLAFDDAHLPVRLVRSSTQVLHAEYVDNFVALGLSKDPTYAVTDSVDRSLRDAGFRTHGPTDAPTIGISHRIGWRIRLGCLAVADMKYASGDLVRVVVSRFTSRALLRRELLSCLQASYYFIESSGHHARVLWSSVKRELRWCAALIALAFRDVNAAWSPMVYCTDASWWGAGVVRGIRSVQEVQHVGHYAERLRYSAAHEAILKPRDSALKCSVSGGVTASPRDSGIPKAPFPEVPESVYGGDWSLVMSQKWSRKEAQVVLEARSLVLTVKNIVRNTQNFGCKRLVLNDCMELSDSMLRRIQLQHSGPRGSRSSAMASSATAVTAGTQLAPRPLGAHAGGLPRAEVAPNLPAPSSRRPYRERVPHGPGAQEAKAAKRARAFPAAAEAPPLPGAPTFLELQSVSPKAAQDYQTYATAFYQWGQERHLLSDIATSLRSAPAIDLALVTYMHEKFFAGELSYVPTKLIAGLRYFWTYPNGAPLELPRSFRALTGWKRMVPAQSRLPYPWVMEALASIITFTFYLRPSECLRLQGKLITAPAQAPRRVQDGQGQMRPLLLHPQEGGATSKTGRVDESLLADNPLFPWLPQVLGLLKAKLPHSLVFNFGQAQWGRALKGAASACGLTALGDPCLHRLRHGGASHDLLFKARILLGAKKRGRWASDRSLARYERGGRINEQLSLLSQDVLIAADLAASNIGQRGVPAALEIFAGSRHLPEVWRRSMRSAGHPVFEIDIRHGVEHDMCSKALVKLIRGWVRGGLATAVFMGTPCNSFSLARNRPNGPPTLRTSEYPEGLPKLSDSCRKGEVQPVFAGKKPPSARGRDFASETDDDMAEIVQMIMPSSTRSLTVVVCAVLIPSLLLGLWFMGAFSGEQQTHAVGAVGHRDGQVPAPPSAARSAAAAAGAGGGGAAPVQTAPGQTAPGQLSQLRPAGDDGGDDQEDEEGEADGGAAEARPEAAGADVSGAGDAPSDLVSGAATAAAARATAATTPPIPPTLPPRRVKHYGEKNVLCDLPGSSDVRGVDIDCQGPAAAAFPVAGSRDLGEPAEREGGEEPAAAAEAQGEAGGEAAAPEGDPQAPDAAAGERGDGPLNEQPAEAEAFVPAQRPALRPVPAAGSGGAPRVEMPGTLAEAASGVGAPQDVVGDSGRAPSTETSAEEAAAERASVAAVGAAGGHAPPAGPAAPVHAANASSGAASGKFSPSRRRRRRRSAQAGAAPAAP